MGMQTRPKKQLTAKAARRAYEHLVTKLRDFHDFIYNGADLPSFDESASLAFVKCLAALESFLVADNRVSVGATPRYNLAWADKFLKRFGLDGEFITLRDNEGTMLTLSSYQTPFVAVDPFKSTRYAQVQARRIGLPVAVCYEQVCKVKNDY